MCFLLQFQGYAGFPWIWWRLRTLAQDAESDSCGVVEGMHKNLTSCVITTSCDMTHIQAAMTMTM